MLRFLTQRLVGAVPVLLGVSIAVFLMVHLLPGDPATIMLQGAPASAEDIANLRHELGLDRPLHVQYVTYMERVLQGDLGKSIHTRRPVIKEIFGVFPSTLRLAFAAMAVALALGISMGILAALRQNSWLDSFSMGTALFGVSMPDFWIGLLLILIFSVRLGWFPATGIGDWKHIVLPAVALGANFAAIIARLVRSSLLEVMRQDYVLSARAKGLKQRTVIMRHALRNALIPVVTIVGLQFGNLLGGAVVIETVFARQGFGRLAITAILAKDFPLIQGVVLFGAIIYVILNILVDLSYAWLDPRIKYESLV
ncbi:MAG: peptide/nickel transport system permease protein [Thermomicrobiales bacterium]|nr:peptide/nickel transport system permease protein [Thermomicrobiales bacterium]MEA2527043.1 peptide/nickel transport system permease protein [Thermomicrobiales bacterium]MEA2583753.1 peptide/nickel transport system permease protein [Thermomicrobiales bacterium]